jgi:hypothetical protein
MLATSIASPQRHVGFSVEPGTSRRSNAAIGLSNGVVARHLRSLTRAASFGCIGYFNEATRVNVVDVAIDRNMPCDERMFTDAAHVLNYA